MTEKEMVEEMNKRYVVIPQEEFVGYRKVPEGAVVLTREEYEDLLKGVHTHNYTAMFDNAQAHRIVELENRLCHASEQARKETAREILNKVDYESNGQTKQITDLLRKQFGVEIEGW